MKNERAPRKSSIQGARLSLSLPNLTGASKMCLKVARRGDNQMAIAKKTRDMLLPTLRIHGVRELSLARTRLRLNDVDA